MGARPVELRRIHRRQFDHGDGNRAVIVLKLGAQRIGETAQRVLGATIGGLQRNAAIGQSRADLNDGAAVARPHMAQRRHRPMHHAEIGHFGHAAEFVRCNLPDRREHGHHCVIDPDVDAAALGDDRLGGLEHGVGIGDIHRNHQRGAAELFRLLLDCLERGGIARDQSEIGASASEAQRDGAADAR
jgi:hypothetical protein